MLFINENVFENIQFNNTDIKEILTGLEVNMQFSCPEEWNIPFTRGNTTAYWESSLPNIENNLLNRFHINGHYVSNGRKGGNLEN